MKMDESANYCEKRSGFLLDSMKVLGDTIETIDLLDLMKVLGDTIETIDLFIKESKMDESANYCEMRSWCCEMRSLCLDLTEVLSETIETIDLLIKERKMVESAKKSKWLDVVKELIKDRRVIGICGLGKITTGKRSFSATFESRLKISRDLLNEKRKMDESANYCEKRSEGGWIELTEEVPRVIAIWGMGGMGKTTIAKSSLSNIFESRLKRVSMDFCDVESGIDGNSLLDTCDEESPAVVGIHGNEVVKFVPKRLLVLLNKKYEELKYEELVLLNKLELLQKRHRLIMEFFRGSVKEVNEKTTETCLHVAGNFDLHLLVLDYKGKIAFTSTKQFQTSTELPPLNSGGFVVMDISYDLPYLDNVDISIHGIVQEPRALITWDLTKEKIKHPGDYSQRELFKGSRDLPEEKIKHNNDCSHRGLSNDSRDFTIQIIKPSDDYSHRGLSNGASDMCIVGPSVGTRIVFLLIATLIAATTCQVPFHFLGNSSSKERPDQFKIMCTLFILCNSMVFIASVGVITFLLHEFPLKPWPHISILALFGSYMLSLNAIMPNGAPALSFISIPILLIGICRETLWLCKSKA